MADTSPRLPPVPIGRFIEAVRRQLRQVQQRMVPASTNVFEMMTGSWVARAIYVATELGIPDVLSSGPLPPEAIADKVGANPEAVYRLLRMLASKGIFARNGPGRFALTPMANALRSDVPGSLRETVLFLGHPMHWEHWGHLGYSVQTGRPSVDALRGKPMFECLDDNPELAAVFNAGMSSVSDMEIGPILAAYDFSRFRTIVDVGGGHGRLLAAILDRAPRSCGILFDSESVVAGAAVALKAAGVADRCAATPGSFFESVPAGGDAYILKHIVHDWEDPKAQAILASVRAVIPATGKLLLMEAVVPDDNREHFAKLLDLEMLVTGAGKERTAAEYRDLLAKAQFRQSRIVNTVGPISVIEAEPA
jgi:O-methyltransferase domain/Dimerisation domain